LNSLRVAGYDVERRLCLLLGAAFALCMSALLLKADMCKATSDVGFGPKAD